MSHDPGQRPTTPYWRLYVDDDGVSRQERCALTDYALKGVGPADPQWNDQHERVESTVVFTVQPVTHILLVDSILAGDGGATKDVLQHHVLPCFVLGLLLMGVIIRLVRINVIQAMKGDYVEAARARGISERNVVRRHAFRNALVPVITVIGLQVALSISGAVLTEKVFSMQGMGALLLDSIQRDDLQVVVGITLFAAFLIAVANAAVDIVYGLIDPRVRAA